MLENTANFILKKEVLKPQRSAPVSPALEHLLTISVVTIIAKFGGKLTVFQIAQLVMK